MMSDTVETTETQGTEAATGGLRDSLGKPSQAQEFLSTLPETLREEPSLKNVKSVEDMATQLVNSQKLIGKKNSAPETDDWDEYRSFFNGIGAPEDVSGYEFEVGENVQESGYDVEGFKTLAHEIGLTPKQAQKLFEKHSGQVLEQLTAQKDAEAQVNKEFDDLALKTFGGAESYEKATAVAQEFITNNVPQNLQMEIKGLDNKSLLALVYTIDKARDSFKKEDQPMSSSTKANPEAPMNAIDIRAEMDKLYADPAYRKDPRIQDQYLKLTAKLMKLERGA